MRVLIVGAGPTGAALSLLLVRRGFKVVLLDRELDLERVFRGEALMPSGVDAIAQMGLRKSFERLPQQALERIEVYVEGDRLIHVDGPEVSGANAIHVVSQPALISPAHKPPWKPGRMLRTFFNSFATTDERSRAS